MEKWIKRVFIILVCFVIAYVVYGETSIGMDYDDSRMKYEKYTGNWERVEEDGTRTPIRIPTKLDVPRGEELIIETILPANIENEFYFSYTSAKQRTRIWVDGELRQEYGYNDENRIAREIATYMLLIPIHKDDAGKTLRMSLETETPYSGIVTQPYVGTEMGLWKQFLGSSVLEIIVAMFMIFLGIITLVASAILSKNDNNRWEIKYLSCGVIMAGTWLGANSMFRQLGARNISVINDLAFFMILLLPIPFLFFVNQLQKGRYSQYFHAVEIVSILDFIVCSGLHITRVIDFSDSITGMAIICGCAIGLIAITMVVDMKRGLSKEYRLVGIGMLCTFLGAIVQIVIYFARSSSFSGVYLAIGLLALLGFSVAGVVNSVLETEREKNNALYANEAKDQFLANMSHEIRTPINTVLGLDTMILRESKEKKIKEYAMDIRTAGQSLLSIINDILDISKIEAGKMEIIPVDYDFASMINDITNMIRPKSKEKNLKFIVEIDENIPSRLHGDDVRIRQVLVNFLTNAVKYTQEGGVTFAVSMESVEMEEEHGNAYANLRFLVKDTGIGIKEEDIGKLAQKFERIEESRNRNIEGTGLGISIATSFLKMMDSELCVSSVYGEGSEFSFLLRQKVVDVSPVGNFKLRIREEAEQFDYQVMLEIPEVRILVVDDNKMNRKVFAELVMDMKCRIDEADSGMRCLQMVQETEYDLIFMDYMMPEMDGVQTFQEIKRMRQDIKGFANKDTPVVILTANAISGAKEQYLAQGFDDYLSKPIIPEKLESCIAQFIPDDKKIIPEQGNIVAKENLIGDNGNSAARDSSENLPPIDGVDWDYALLKLKKISILKNAVKEFVLSSSSEMEKLGGMYDCLVAELESDQDDNLLDQAYKEYRIQVHAMKSGAATIGAVFASSFARALEYAARDKDGDKICKVMGVFENEWSQVTEQIRETFAREYPDEFGACFGEKKEDKDSKEPLDSMMLEQYLAMLDQAIGNLDTDTADEIVEELKKYRYSEEEEKILENIEIAVHNLDIERTQREIGRWKIE